MKRTMAVLMKNASLILFVVSIHASIAQNVWDPEEEYWRLEFPGQNSFEKDEARRLHVMTSRNSEVTRHRDIVTRANGGSPRVFDNSGSCGVDDDQTPCCNQTCSDLSYCSALNGKRIEDKYYPTLPFIQVRKKKNGQTKLTLV